MVSDRKALRRRVGEFVESRRPGWLDAPGAVVGLTDRDRTLGVVPIGARDAFTGAPVKKDTRFEIGSISKSFAAIVALQLVEEGLLDLRAPVTEYVPWFEVHSTFAPITPHHLLTHTSGLIMGMDFADDAVPPVWSLRDTTVGFPPGAHFHYSNDGYKLLGLILETLGGRPWREMLRERVLAPLGMTATDPDITFESLRGLATPHQRLANDRPPHRGMPLTVSPPTISTTADGSIVSTARDMAAYARMLLNRGAYGEGRLLSEESFAAFTHPYVADTGEPGFAYGYGIDVFEVDGRPHIGHAGGMVGHYALLWCDTATGAGVAMMVNGVATTEPSVGFALDSIRAHLAGEALPIVPPAPDPLATPLAGELAGEYTAVDGSSLSLKQDDGRLVFASGNVLVTLEPLEDERFAVPASGADRFALTLERDAAGGILGVCHGPRRFLRAGGAAEPEPDPLVGWELLVGTYRITNPWSPGFRVFLRAGRLWLAWPGAEHLLTPLADGTWHVGDGWSPDRVRFDTVVAGVAQHATYNAVLYCRSFLD
jgi:D-alanyl-D-alanine carboxypeptidase